MTQTAGPQPRFRGRIGRARHVAGALAVLAASTLVPAPASASLVDIAFWTVRGHVSTLDGEPLAGAYVTDGSSYVDTDANGYYEFPVEYPTAEVSLAAGKYHFECCTWRSVTVLDAQEEIDFGLSASVSGWMTPRHPGALPAMLTSTARVPAPLADVCVDSYDHRSGSTSALSPLGDDEWSGTLEVPAATAPGIYFVDFIATRCATGARLGEGVMWGHYVVDWEPPTAELLKPRAGHLSIHDADLGPSSDGSTQVVGPPRVSVRATDDAGFYFVHIRAWDAGGELAEDCTFHWNWAQGNLPRDRTLSCTLLLGPGAYELEAEVQGVGPSTTTERFPIYVLPSPAA